MSLSALLGLMQLVPDANARDPARWWPTFPASYDLALHFDVPLDRDVATVSVLKRLDEVTADWPRGRRLSLLLVVTTIVAAEKSRAAWNPKKLDERYRRLAIEAVKSARLARTLSGFFPHPPDEIRQLIGQLVHFMEAAVEESLILDRHFAIQVARKALSGFRSGPSTSRVSNIMLADLVELALGRKPGARVTQFDESAIRRRYLRDRDKRPKTSASAVWKRSWKLLTQVAKLPPDIATRSESTGSAFRTSIRAFLQESRASLSTQPPVRRRRGGSDAQGKLDEAKRLRAVLTRRLQWAEAESIGHLLYETAIKNVIDEELSASSPEQKEALLTQIKSKSGGMKPSSAAARISAGKYDLSLRQVRAGRTAQPVARQKTRRVVVPVKNLEVVEHVMESKRRGRLTSSHPKSQD